MVCYSGQHASLVSILNILVLKSIHCFVKTILKHPLSSRVYYCNFICFKPFHFRYTSCILYYCIYLNRKCLFHEIFSELFHFNLSALILLFQIHKFLDDLASKNPNIASTFSIGKSSEGNDLKAIKVSRCNYH